MTAALMQWNYLIADNVRCRTDRRKSLDTTPDVTRFLLDILARPDLDNAESSWLA